MSAWNPRQQDGFTLVEVLVAMLTGLVVVAALFTILEVSVRQTSRISDSVQADTLGRAAMTTVVGELRSACIGREFAPVQAESSGTKLIFVTAASANALIKGEEAFEHVIEWQSHPKGGTLIDTAYRSNGGSWPNFTFETKTPASTTVLGERERINEIGKEAIFRYEKYATKSSSTSTTALGTLEPLKTKEGAPLSSEEAKAVSAVLVSFTTAPVDNNLKLFQGDEFGDLVTFAFAAPASEATIQDGPCR